MKRLVFAVSLGILIVGLLAVSASASYTRIDVNGQLVNQLSTLPSTSPAGNTDYIPTGWTWYNTSTTNGGLGTGNFLTAFQNASDKCAVYEDEEPYSTHSYPGGHSVMFGGDGGNAGHDSLYGLKQNFNATAGKIYLMTGTGKFGPAHAWTASTGVNKYMWDFGMAAGADNLNAGERDNGVFDSGPQNGGAFYQAIVAQTTGVYTAHAGIYSKGNSTEDINAWMDGIRIYEVDVPVYNDLTNGDFSGAATDLSRYNVMAPDPSVGIPASTQYALDGWNAVGGGGMGRYCQVTKGAFDGHADVINMTLRKGQGRVYQMQRVNKGAGTYGISGFYRAGSSAYADCNVRVGIDTTGGLDPTAGTVVWSDAASLVNFQNFALNNVVAGSNGITIFLGVGNDATAIDNYTGGAFDDLALTFVPVPEPGSLLALGTGLLGLVGMIRRRK